MDEASDVEADSRLVLAAIQELKEEVDCLARLKAKDPKTAELVMQLKQRLKDRVILPKEELQEVLQR